MPLGFVGYWLIFVPKAKLRWRVVLGWLVYPLAYMIFVLVRGSLVGRYPYPFLDGHPGIPPSVIERSHALVWVPHGQPHCGGSEPVDGHKVKIRASGQA